MSNTKKNEDVVKNDYDTVKFPVDINGKVVELECVADILDAPMEAAEHFENNNTYNFFKVLLGPAQMSKLSATGATVRDFETKVVSAWQEATGLGN